MFCVTEDEALKLALEVVQEGSGPIWTPGDLLDYADEVQTQLDSLTARLIDLTNSTR